MITPCESFLLFYKKNFMLKLKYLDTEQLNKNILNDILQVEIPKLWLQKFARKGDVLHAIFNWWH